MCHSRRFLTAVLIAVGGLLAIASVASAWWTPPQHLTWYWQLQGTVKIQPVMTTDFDGFDHSADTVQRFGQKAICYIDVGTWENWRPDASQFPGSVKGRSNGWPGEKWLDIRSPLIRPLLHSRFAMCRQKGFDAVEPDNMDGYTNRTGFPLKASDQLAFNEWVASDVHSLDLAVFQKNDTDQASTLQPYFDGIIDEQCNQYSECNTLQPYLSAGKPALNAEYKSFSCPADNLAGIMGAQLSVNLDGSNYKPCWGP
jgi:hypothetical protein